MKAGTELDERTGRVRDVANRWFASLGSGDLNSAIGLLDDDIEWINYTPVPGYNTEMSWIGTYRGRDAVVDSFRIFGDLVEVRSEDLLRLIVDGEDAIGVIRESSTVKRTGMDFEIEFVQWLTIRNGKIIRWKSYTDPSQILRALRGDRAGAGDMSGAGET